MCDQDTAPEISCQTQTFFSKTTSVNFANLPSDYPSGGRSFFDYFLIHGNKASTTLSNPDSTGFDDFNPDHSFLTFSDRLKRYASAHSRAVDMAAWIGANVSLKTRKSLSIPSVKNDLESCGSYLTFKHFYTINKIKLSGMCSCKRHLLCPLCAIRRAAKSVKAYLDRLQVLYSQHPSLRPYLVTFTVKDGPDLEERFNHLQKNLRFYYDMRRKALSAKSGKSRHLPVEANRALGGVGSYEVKRGANSGIWHPHAHFIWLCASPPDVNRIREEWHHLTGDSFIVDVTPFYSPDDVAGGFLEVFKYALKYSTMTLEDNWESFLVLRSRRLISSFGIFRGVEVPEQDTDEITEDDLPYIELFFRYMSGSYEFQNYFASTSQQGNERSE